MTTPTLLEAASRHPAAPARTGNRITTPVLVDARWLLEHADEVCVIDTRPVAAHAATSIPGSVSFALDALLVDDSSRPALQRLGRAAQAALAARGIAPTDHVALVDDTDGSAALGATVCELAGLRSVTVVHGSGVAGWVAHGGKLATGDTRCDPVDLDVWLHTPLRTGTVAAFEDLVDAVIGGRARILDVRSQLEHEGIVGSPCCADRGAIPGSVHLEWTELLDMSGGPCSSDRTRAVAEHVGVGIDDRIIVTCHAGHRAAIAARALRAAGFRNVRVSLGSWHEWAARGLGCTEAAPAAG